MKKAIIAGAVIAAILGVIFLFSGKEKHDINDAAREADAERPPRYVAAEGKVETLPGLEVEVGTEIAGVIDRFYFNEGDTVKKGDVIAAIRNADIAARLKAAEAAYSAAKAAFDEAVSGARDEEIKRARAVSERTVSELELAEKNLERYNNLFNSGYISRSELDDSEISVKVAMARVKEASEELSLLEKGVRKETLRMRKAEAKQAAAEADYYRSIIEKTRIKSPISGKVIHKYVEEGEGINTDNPIVSVADIEKIRINAEVDETDIGRVHVGDRAEVTMDAYPGKIFGGQVEEISDYVGVRSFKPNDQSKNVDIKVVQVRIGLSDKTPLKLGMTVDIKIMPKSN